MGSVRFATLVAVVVAVAAVVGGAQPPSSVWDGIYTAEQAERGESLYDTGCASCHGAALEGAELAPMLVGGDFMWTWDGLSVGDLFERLRVSMPEGDPSKMSRAEKADILAFILSRNAVPPGQQELSARTSQLQAIRFEALPPQ